MESVAKGLVHVHATVIMVLAVGLNQWQPMDKQRGVETGFRGSPEVKSISPPSRPSAAASQSQEQTKQASDRGSSYSTCLSA